MVVKIIIENETGLAVYPYSTYPNLPKKTYKTWYIVQG